jgi:hypothetical protein
MIRGSRFIPRVPTVREQSRRDHIHITLVVLFAIAIWMSIFLILWH